ncbi:MAG: Beta-glucosidase-related glycosidase, partial [Herbinix sp.]|nr:Beta-glucosidase-related glycosidase [Herbinix sp.]
FPVGATTDENVLKQIVGGLGIGGMMYRADVGETVQNIHRILQSYAKIPMLLAANLETGSTGLVKDGTNYAHPMQASASGDEEAGYKLGKVACSEGAQVGCNVAFAPIVDIDMNFRNPITNLRTFGSDVDKVIQMASGYLRAAKEENLATTIKHFPGDGVDERDQHLLTSINSLSVQEWDATFGKVYQTLIDQGSKMVMIGHIAQPAYVHELNPEIPARNVVPATLSPELLQGLLRGKLGFNGVTITDASPMVGFCVGMKREDAVPTAIAAGCDMFLFNKDMQEDFGFLMAGYQKGIITEERLNEAVTRILALKASLGLHEKQQGNTLVPGKEALAKIRLPKYVQWEKECADLAVTLVKDNAHLLPLSPKKYKRVYLNVIEENDSMETPNRQLWKKKLEDQGFEVTLRNRDTNFDMAALLAGKPDARAMELTMEAFSGVKTFTEKYDLVLYVCNLETASNNTVIRINWKGLGGMGNDTPWFVQEIPTLFISTANPYHLLDVPMIPTYINAYSSSEVTIDAVIEKLLGRSEFTGASPVDPFCGRWDTEIL